MRRTWQRAFLAPLTISIVPWLLFASPLLLSGCTTISQFWAQHSGTSPAPEQASEELIPKSPDVTPEPESGAQIAVRPLNLDAAGEIEVTWAVPDEPVDSYVLHYGFTRDELDQELVIDVATLEKTAGPQHLPMYRFRLQNVPIHKNVYVALSAVRAGGVSAMTEVIEVQRLPGARP